MAEYIAEHSGPARAAAWLEGLERVVHSLAGMPGRHPPAREAAALGVDLRQAVFKSHRVLFLIRGRVVHVLHVLHVRHASRSELPGVSEP